MRPAGPLRGVGRAGPIGVAILAVAVYANSLGNGFAFDDAGIIVDNPTVTNGDPLVALTAPYWAGEAGVGRLFRPVTQAAFALQWRLFGGEPFGVHLVNVLLHALVAVMVLALCAWLLRAVASDSGTPDSRWTTGAALFGGALFAVHPVHVEGVANGVGQSELWAAAGTLAALLVHLGTRAGGAGRRVAGTLAVAGCYAVAFGAKESAVVLPALLLLVEAAESRSTADLAGRLKAEAPRFALLAAVGGSLLVARIDVLGALSGEDVTAVLLGMGPGERIVHALPVWVEYLRLAVWPLDLSADYDPGVIYSASGPAGWQVAAGALLVVATLATAVGGWRRNRGAAVAAWWFLITIALASNLLLATGSIMAERTLYLPSVALSLGAALGVAALGRAALGRGPSFGRRTAWAGIAVLALLSLRTLDRNPTWFSSFTVMETLAREHPESWRARMARAQGLARAGDDAAAIEAYRSGVEALPTRFDLVSETGAFLKERRRLDDARPYLEAGVQLQPERPSGWVLLAELELLQGRFQQAHAVAARGIGTARASGELWAVLSESYAGGGLLDAAIRARRAALALDPTDESRRRLDQLLAAAAGVAASTEASDEAGR